MNARTAAPIDPILATWKISEVLARYPDLLEVLIELSPAFRRLRNPILRRVQSRLVTVAQAARIAGLQPAEVVLRLNEAVGLVPPPGPVVDVTTPPGHDVPPEWLGQAPVAAALDVRPLEARGEEPFSAISRAAAPVPAGQMLRLRNTFEPLPLNSVLARRGFQHWARRLGPDDWEVFFYRPPSDSRSIGLLKDVAQPSPSPHLRTNHANPTPAPGASKNPSATITIDVSDLVPPEPMVRILETLELLEPGATLLVSHVRRPVYLYPRLDQLGYQHETCDRAPGQVEILIHKPAAKPAKE